MAVRHNINKEQTYGDFLEMIQKSWTWARMTDDERETFADRLYWYAQREAAGNYDARWKAYNVCYNFYLLGLGCGAGAGCDWRADRGS